MNNKLNGFTLVEILATFVVLGIVATIAIFSISSITDNYNKNTFKESVSNALEAASNYYSSTGSFPDNGLSITSNLLNVDNQSQYLSGTIIFNSTTGKMEAKNVSSSDYCVNGPVDNLTVNSGSCAATKDSCFVYRAVTSTSGKKGIEITDFNYSDSSCLGDVIVPKTINGSNVVSIGRLAFADYDASLTSTKCEDHYFSFGYCIPTGVPTNTPAYVGDSGRGITSLSLPSTVETIGAGAFAKLGITSINLDSLTDLYSIGVSAFAESYLTYLDLSNLSNLNYIDGYAFAENNITKINITNMKELTTISAGAFASNAIGSVDFTSDTSLSTIGDYAFQENKIAKLNLSSLVNLSSVGTNAFCSNTFATTGNYPDTTKLKNVSAAALTGACLNK